MIILPEDKNIIMLLSAEDAQQVLIALFSEDDDTPNLSPLANMAYITIKSKSDRISERKAKAGKQGGARENNQNAKNKQNTEKQAEQADEENSTETTYRTSTVTDTVSVTDTDDNNPPNPPQTGGTGDGDDKTPKKSNKEKQDKLKAELNQIFLEKTQGFGIRLTNKVKEFLDYKKTEKNFSYKPIGLKNLLDEISQKLVDYGELAVIETISHAMASSWKGIFWDRIKPSAHAPPANNKGDERKGFRELVEERNKGKEGDIV